MVERPGLTPQMWSPRELDSSGRAMQKGGFGKGTPTCTRWSDRPPTHSRCLVIRVWSFPHGNEFGSTKFGSLILPPGRDSL